MWSPLSTAGCSLLFAEMLHVPAKAFLCAHTCIHTHTHTHTHTEAGSDSLPRCSFFKTQMELLPWPDHPFTLSLFSRPFIRTPSAQILLKSLSVGTGPEYPVAPSWYRVDRVQSRCPALREAAPHSPLLADLTLEPHGRLCQASSDFRNRGWWTGRTQGTPESNASQQLVVTERW